MEKDNLDKLFERLQGSFDTEEPAVGHRERFLERLEDAKGLTETTALSESARTQTPSWKTAKESVTLDPRTDATIGDRQKTLWKSSNIWKSLAIAASFALICLLTVGSFEANATIEDQIAEISPEVSRTQYYFAGLIEQQINELESKDNPQTRQVIADAMAQLQKLESDYARLETDLIDGGNSKLILSAMITNFRTRIDLLQDVSNEIETIKKINATDDTTTTI